MFSPALGQQDGRRRGGGCLAPCEHSSLEQETKLGTEQSACSLTRHPLTNTSGRGFIMILANQLIQG